MTKFHCLIACTPWDVEHMCIVIICLPGYDNIKFERNLNPLINLFTHMTKKVKTKIQIS